jgi:phosphoglycerate dehydrogenase-like enzyme
MAARTTQNKQAKKNEKAMKSFLIVGLGNIGSECRTKVLRCYTIDHSLSY